jgi:salicylate hydroxylase
MSGSHILIAGGGLGGLATAIAIGQTGRRVTLVERAPRFEPIGYGIQIGPNALHVFERLGMLDKVLAYCSQPKLGLLSDALTNETLLTVPMADRMMNRFGQPYAVIHRGDLHEVMIEVCDSLSNVKLRNNFDVVQMDDTGSGVTLTSTDGEQLRGDALVAADGIWSTIRNQLFPGTPPPFASRYVVFRALLPVEEVAPDLIKSVVNFRCGTDFHLVHYLLRQDTLLNIVAGIKVPDHIAMDDQEGVTAHLETAFADGCEEVGRLLSYVDRSRYWIISNLLPLHQWTKGRTVLLGDSAHAMVQAMAQGACQAVEDAYVLAKHIATSDTVENAFQLFQDERHSRATYVQYRSLYVWELIHVCGGWRDLRKEKLAELSEEDALTHLEWLYSAEPGSKLHSELSWT